MGRMAQHLNMSNNLKRWNAVVYFNLHIWTLYTLLLPIANLFLVF